MSTDFSIENIFQKYLFEYYNTFNITPVPFEIHIVDDMHQEYINLCPNRARRHSDSYRNIDDYNGIAVPPETLDGNFAILINKKLLKEYMEQDNPTWIGTIAHETTHIIDYISYAELVNAKNYDEILLIENHGMFNLWTEFNARAKGYYFIRKYSFDNMFDEKQVEDVMKRELPEQTKILLTNYNSTSNGYMQAYYVSNYLGRLFALQQIFPKHFSNRTIKEIIGPNEWMYDWFVFLSTHTNLEKAYRDFNDMRDILRKNFMGF